jgi:hypothetical protein
MNGCSDVSVLQDFWRCFSVKEGSILPPQGKHFGEDERVNKCPSLFLFFFPSLFVLLGDEGRGGGRGG